MSWAFSAHSSDASSTSHQQASQVWPRYRSPSQHLDLSRWHVQSYEQPFCLSSYKPIPAHRKGMLWIIMTRKLVQEYLKRHFYSTKTLPLWRSLLSISTMSIITFSPKTVKPKYQAQVCCSGTSRWVYLRMV